MRAPYDAVLILGKHLGVETDRAERELRARAAAAAAVWRAGVPVIGTLEAHLVNHPRTGSEVVVELLHELGVPDSAIYRRDWTCSTRDEVVRGTAWFRELGASRGLVLTARYHVPRTRRLFREEGYEAIVQSPEGLWRFADERERAWIAAGEPDDAVMRREAWVEGRWSLLEAATRWLPLSVRSDLEIRAGRRYRGPG